MASTSGLELLYHTISNDIETKEDVFVCQLHWCMLINGYKCIGKENEIPKDVKAVRSTEMLPQHWNENHDAYTLQYLSEDAAKNQAVILIKIIRIDDNILINAYNSENEMTTNLTISTADYIADDIHHFDRAFINTAQFLPLFQAEILNGLFPEPPKPQVETSRTPPPSNWQTQEDPLREPVRLPRQPSSGWADLRDPMGGVGRADLDPFGRIGGGMLMDPRHRFPGVPFNPSTGIPGQLPRGAVPPGARFDPFAPPDHDLQPSRGHPPTGPNPDHLRPPDYDDMFS